VSQEEVKMILTLQSITDFDKQHEFLVGTRFGVRNIEFSDAEIKDMDYSRIYLNIDQIIHENDLDEIKDFMKTFKDVLGFYYSDMAVYMIAKEIGVVEKLIYNPGTLVTSVADAEFYLGLGIKRVCLSREITLEDILKFSHLKEKVEIIIHGKLNMFYSKRKLLTNYFTYIQEEIQKKGELEEEIREERYPVIEDQHGTNIFHENAVNSFEEFEQIKSFTMRIDGYLLDNFDDVVSFYERVSRGEDGKLLKEEYLSKYDDIFSGYYYKETLNKK
jgi:putative protease